MVSVSKGFGAGERAEVARLYWQAFGGKLGRVMGPDGRALTFVEQVLSPGHALCARDGGGALLGVAGFKTPGGALVGGGYPEMAAIYGRWGALWRGVLLGLLERDVDNDRFLLDGIFVAERARGMGVGTALLRAVIAEAGARGYDEVRLDVIDSNPRARALYEREGFAAVDESRLGLLRLVFGFARATTMVRSTERGAAPDRISRRPR